MMTMHALIHLAQVEAQPLIDPFKWLLLVLPILPWAWLVSTKLEKDAVYFHLDKRLWNGIYLGTGGAAVVAMLLIPIFWIGWPVGVILLWTPIIIYWQYRNKQVPEEHIFRLTGDTIRERLEKRRQASAARSAAISFVGPDGTTVDVPMKEDPRFPVHLIVEDLLGPAVAARASRLEIAISQSGAQVTQTIDGVRYRRDPLTAEDAASVIDYLKSVAGLDVQNRRRRQVGTFRMEDPEGESKVLTATTAGSSNSQELRLEFDRETQLNRPYDGIGLLPQQMEQLEFLEDREKRTGIVLLGAPSGHGLSTMAYSFLGHHDAFTANVKTWERETLIRLDGVDHLQFDSSSPEADYATGLQSILRRDPDIVMVGDIEQGNTAEIAAFHATDSDPLLYVCQHQGSVQEQIVDWVKRVGDIKQAVKPLLAVVNGRLVRELCPNCRQPYTPNPEQLKKLGLPGDVKQLYKASGKVQVKNKIENCSVCQGTGYFGQTGVFEVMVLDNKARKLLLANDLQGAYMHCRGNKMIFLQQAGLRRVVEGRTTLEEVARVAGATSKKSSHPTPRPQPTTA